MSRRERRGFPGAVESLRLPQGEGGDLTVSDIWGTLHMQSLQRQLPAAAQEPPEAAGTEQQQ